MKLWSLSPAEAHKELVLSAPAPRQPGWLKSERLPELGGEVSHQMLHCPLNLAHCSPQRLRDKLFSDSRALYIIQRASINSCIFFVLPVCFLIKFDIKLKSMERGNSAGMADMGFDTQWVFGSLYLLESLELPTPGSLLMHVKYWAHSTVSGYEQIVQPNSWIPFQDEGAMRFTPKEPLFSWSPQLNHSLNK